MPPESKDVKKSDSQTLEARVERLEQALRLGLGMEILTPEQALELEKEQRELEQQAEREAREAEAEARKAELAAAAPAA